MFTMMMMMLMMKYSIITETIDTNINFLCLSMRVCFYSREVFGPSLNWYLQQLAVDAAVRSAYRTSLRLASLLLLLLLCIEIDCWIRFKSNQKTKWETKRTENSTELRMVNMKLSGCQAWLQRIFKRGSLSNLKQEKKILSLNYSSS
jgi:hypothetical protein